MVEQGISEEPTFGRYRLLSRLGEGGMAEVFKAKSFGVEGFEKVVVIKRILPQLARYKAFVDMFVHEAKIAVRLSHANVVQVFDLGRVDTPGEAPAYFMAMEYVAGMDLASLFERCRAAGVRPPPGLSVYIACQVAKGLDHAHRRRDDGNQPLGIVHRDISPQNILLSWEGEVKVTDFGIAKARDSLDDIDDSRVKVLKGKYSYMSPEQARGEPVDGRTDLFSLGTVLYEGLAGVNPFRAAQAPETLRRVREAEYPPLSLVVPDAPSALIELVHRALAPTPEGRFEDAARMYEALLSYSYQSGARFGATDLADFLQQLRQAPVAAEGRPRQESTPVQVPSPPPSLVAEPPSLPEVGGALVTLREVTALCLRVHPGGAGALPREVAARAASSCERLGGRRIERPGEVLALFGLGEADPRDTEHAVRAGAAALRACAELRRRVGVGVVVGRLRVDAGGELVHGDEEDDLFERARRLADAADGQVLMGPMAARQVRGLFALTEAAGGFAVGAPRPAQEVYGKFVGRRDELARLGTLLGNASKRQLQVITVTGPAGVGKTRLLHEVDRRLRRGEFNVGVYVAPCSPRGREAPLSGASAMLQVLCGVQEGDGADKARQIAPSLRALGLLDDEVDAVLSQLGVPEIQPEGDHVLRSAFLKTLSRLAEDRVQVFAWDNAQWLDEASAALLSSSLRRLGSTRVALVLAAREGYESPLSRAPGHERVQLGELPEEDAQRLLAAHLGVSELPGALVDFCWRRAGGHPLFIEEIARDLIDAGSVEVQGGAVTRLDLSREGAVPRPLRAVMAGRVERLPVAEQLTLQAAAVVGEVFERDVVLDLVGDDGYEALASLEQRGLVQGASDGACSFPSPLLRDVVLDALPDEARRLLHARAAASLERAGAPLPRIAAQLQEAGRHDEAGAQWARSARRHVAARQYEAAVGEGLRSLALLDLRSAPVDESIELLRALASALDQVRVAPDAPRLLGQAIEQLDHAAPPERVAARVEVARALGAVSRFDAALEALAGVPTAGLTDELRQRLLIAEAELHFRCGDFRRSRAAAEQIQLDALDPLLAPRALVIKIQCHAVAAERGEALTLLGQLPPSDHAAAAARRDKLRALIHFFARAFDESAAASARGAELARQAGLWFETALHLHNLGDVLIFQADYPRAYAALQQSLALCEQHGAERLALQNRMYLGYLDALQGLPGGEALLRDGIAQATAHGYAWDLVNGRYLLGRLLEDMGLPRAACAEFEACAAAARALHNPLIASECDAALARLAPLVS